jgi:hypothetical protein
MATHNADNFSSPIGVSNGGTGVALLTAYAPLCGGTTSTGSLQQATTGLSSTNDVLTSAGSGSLSRWRAPGGPIKITTLTAAVSSSLTFTSSNITSTYNLYCIEFTQILTLAGGQIQMDVSTNGGSSGIGGGYQSCSFKNAYNTATLTRTSATATSIVALLSDSTDTFNGLLFFNAGSGVATSFVGRGPSYSTTGTTLTNHFFGGNNTATSVNGLIFTVSSGGTFTSGTITLYGISS